MLDLHLGASSLNINAERVIGEIMKARAVWSFIGDQEAIATRDIFTDPKRRRLVTEVSISQLASDIGLSQRNLNRLFLAETNLTPKEYLIRRRIERAKKLLKETNMTVTDIAMEVGYNSLSKFIGTFKMIEGILPSDSRGERL